MRMGRLSELQKQRVLPKYYNQYFILFFVYQGALQYEVVCEGTNDCD